MRTSYRVLLLAVSLAYRGGSSSGLAAAEGGSYTCMYDPGVDPAGTCSYCIPGCLGPGYICCGPENAQ